MTSPGADRAGQSGDEGNEFRASPAGLEDWGEEVKRSLAFLMQFSKVLLCYTGAATGLSFLIFLLHGFKVWGFDLPSGVMTALAGGISAQALIGALVALARIIPSLLGLWKDTDGG